MACAAPLLLPSDTLSPKKVENRWGKSQFSIEAFKNGTIDDRAKMAADLISKKELFLKKDAFFFSSIERTKFKISLFTRIAVATKSKS
jgi:hypothetical protein